MTTQLKPDSFYQYKNGAVIKCGDCWIEDIKLTIAGDYTDDEAVKQSDLNPLPDNEYPLQCEDCLMQNAVYDDDDDD